MTTPSRAHAVLRLAFLALLLPLVACGGAGSSGPTVRTAPTTPHAVQIMRGGEAVAVLGDYPAIAYTARESAGLLEVAGEPFEIGRFGIATATDATDLANALTAALRTVMEDGRYVRILASWGLGAGRIAAPAEGGEAPEASAIPQLSDGTLKVGMDIAYAPMEFYDELNHEAGVDVELARALGEQLGVEVQLENMGFDELIPAVQSGTIDMAISSMTITDERSTQVHFIPYLQTGSGILVTQGNPENIRRLADLCGKTVAVQEGTIQIALLEAACQGR